MTDKQTPAKSYIFGPIHRRKQIASLLRRAGKVVTAKRLENNNGKLDREDAFITRDALFAAKWEFGKHFWMQRNEPGLQGGMAQHHQDRLDEMLEYPRHAPKERDFLDDLDHKRDRPLTARQAAWLERIWDKHNGENLR